MNPKRLIPVVLLVAIIGGGYWLDQKRAAQASRLSGFFESQPTSVASRLPGRVLKILVKEGDFVKKGTPLLQLESKPEVADYAAKVSVAKQTQAALAEAVHGPRSEDIARQRAVVAEAEAYWRKVRSGNRPEEVQAGVQRYALAEANFQRVARGARPEEIAQARAAESAALERLKAAERGLTPEERSEVKARLDQALATEGLAVRDLGRYRELFSQGAISQQNLDKAQADFLAAHARSVEQQQAYERATRGTPPEELAEARASYRQAKAAADLVASGSRSEDISAARAQMNEAAESLKLLQKGSRIEDIMSAEARYRQAKATLDELIRGTRTEDIEQAQANAQSAENQAASAKATMSEWVVKAPFDGTVDRILVSEGDLLAARTSVIRMSDPKEIWLRVYVPEGQLSKIKIGDSVALMVDGIEADDPAKVESIATKGEFTPANLQTPEERAKQVFAVRIRLDPPDNRVKAGMGASIRRMGSWP